MSIIDSEEEILSFFTVGQETRTAAAKNNIIT
jgi:hypothetical protein